MASNDITFSSYMKNLMKSAGYISSDILKTYAPTMTSVVKNTKETSEEIYTAISDFTSKSSNSDISLNNFIDKGKNIALNTWNNAIDDIKQGKIYNKERSNAMMMDAASGVFGEGAFDFDFNFDEDDDWGDEDSEDISDDTKVQVSAQAESSKAIMATVDAVGRATSAEITNATVQSASYIAASARENNLALFNLNKEGFGTVTKALMTVNETITGFSKIGEPLTAHMQNSLNFYTLTGEKLDTIIQSLKQIEENTIPPKTSGSEGYKSRRSLGTLMDSDEGINMLELKESIKEGFKQTLEEYDMVKDMITPILDSGGKNINILGKGVSKLAQMFIPEIMKESIKDLDKSVKYGLGAALTKIKKDVSGGGNILYDLLDNLIPGRDTKRTVSLSEYEKGAIQWDGIARKALTDVIPTTLLQIYSAITGTEPMRFDYTSGKYVKSAEIVSRLDNRKKEYVIDSGGDLYKNIKENIDNLDKSQEEKDKMLNNLYTYFEKSFDSGKHNILTESNGIDEETYEIIKNVYNNMKNEGGKARRSLNKWVVKSNVNSEDYANFLRSEESSGYSVLQTVHDELNQNKSNKNAPNIWNNDIESAITTIIPSYLEKIYNIIFAKFTNGNIPNNGAISPSFNQEVSKIPNIIIPGTPKNPGEIQDNKIVIIGSNNNSQSQESEDDQNKEENIGGENTISESNKKIGVPDKSSFSEDDSEEAIAAKEKEAKKEAREKKLKQGGSKIKNILDKFFKKRTKLSPTTILAADFMDNLSKDIDILFFGTEEDPEKGLFSFAFDKIKNSFEELKDGGLFDTIKEKISTFWEEKIKPAWNQSSFKEETTNTLKEVGSKFKGAVTDIAIGGNNEDDKDNGTAARGRKVTKSGVVVVSEGELIIPSELNPFYHGITNKASQIKNENRIARSVGMIPTFAKGEKSVTVDNSGNVVQGNGFVMTDRKRTLGEEFKVKLNDLKEKKKKIKRNSLLGTLGYVIDSVVAPAAETVNETINQVFNKEEVEKTKKEMKKPSEKLADLVGEISGAKGGIGAGALLGAVGSLFTGGIIGPIAGAVLGSSIGFIAKSKKAQDFLFGEEDENGERKRQKLYNIFMKQLPEMGIGAGLGGAVGLFAGSPVLGAFLGASISFMKNSEKFQNWFFGEEDKDGKRKGGAIGNRIFANIDGTFRNINNRIQVWFANLGKSLASKIRKLGDFIKKIAEDPDATFITRILAKSIRAGVKLVKLPFQVTDYVTGKISERVERGNLIKGYSVYDKNKKRNMTAAERIEAANKLSNSKRKKISDEFKHFDEFLASIDDYNECERYKDLIHTIKTSRPDSDSYINAVNELINDPKYKKYMGTSVKSVKFLTKNIEKISSRMGDESARKGLSKEEYIQAREDANAKHIKDTVGWLENIYNVITGKKPSKLLDAVEDQNKEDESKNSKIEIDAFGNIHEYKVDNDGNVTEKLEDRRTKESRTKMDEFFSSITSIPSLIKGVALDVKEVLFGDGEDNKGLFGKYIDKAKGFLKNLVSKIVKPILGLVTGVIGIYTVVNGLFGGEDTFTNKVLNIVGSYVGFGKNSTNSELENGMPNDEGGTKTQFIDSQGNIVKAQFDELGNKTYVNANGEVVDPSTVSRVRAGKDTFISKFKKGNLRQLATGKPLLATKLLKGAVGKLPFGKAITGQLEHVGSNLSSFKADYVSRFGKEAWALQMGDDFGEGLVNSLKNSDGVIAVKVKEILDNALKHMDDIPLLPAKVKQVLPGCFDDLAESIGKNAGKFIGKVGQNISDILPVVNVLMMISDFITGYEDARTTLGITAEPTIPQRIVSGLLRLVKNLIPIIGPFIPDDLIVNVFCNWIAPVYFIKPKELLKQREEAKQEVADYNAEHGTNYTVAEYNKAVLNDYTFTERIGNTFKTTKQQFKDKFAAAKAATQQGGLGAGARELLNLDRMKEAYTEAGGGLNGAWEAIKAQSSGYGVFSDLQTKSMDLVKAAFTGDTKTFFDTNNRVLEGFGDSKSEKGVKSSAFSKTIIGPFNALTAVLTPIALTTGFMHHGFSNVKKLIGAINPINKIKTSITSHLKLAKDGDIKGLFAYKTDDSKGGFSKIYDIMDFNFSTTLLPFTLFMKIGNGIKGFFSNATSSVMADFEGFKGYVEEINGYASSGDIGGVLKSQYKSSSALRQIFSFGATFVKIVSVIRSGFNWILKTLDNFVDFAMDKIKSTKIGQLVLGDSESESGSGKKSVKQKVTETASKAWNWLKDKVGYGSGSGLAVNSSCKNCEGYISQLDDRFKNIPLANSTVGEIGCGPAVGAMVSKTMGGDTDMNKAIDDARAYTNNNGTSIKYFKDKFNASELNNKNSVKQALESNRPVILLGKDPSNTSKAKSPFGPKNHYVLATSMKNGKVLVNDPENRSPMVYNSSILDKSKINLTYGGTSGLRGMGTGVTKTSVSDTIWNVLKSEGFSDEAAAGILGNAQQESTMSPTADAAAYGLFQFEKSTGSASGLEDYASNLGKSKDDPETQTKYMLSLFKNEISAYSGNGIHVYDNGTETWWPTKLTLDDYKSLTDPREAAEIFERTYERPSIPMREQRKEYAADFYDLYKGTSGNSSSSKDESSEDESSDSSSSSSSSGNLLTDLLNIFGSITNVFNLKDGFSINSSDSGDSSSSSKSKKSDKSNSSGGVTNAVGAQSAANAATNELGYPESGDNITKFGEWSGCNGQPWCAAFAAWAISQAFDGTKDKAVQALYNCSNVNYTPTLTQSFKDNAAWYSEPEVGDEVMYGNPGAYHVGLVTAVDKANKTYTSVEGNTGDKVTQKEHSSYMDGNVIGYGRPDYTGATANIALNNTTNDEDNTISGDEDFKATGSGLRGGSSGLLNKFAPSRFVYGSKKGQKLFSGSSGISGKNARFRGAGSEMSAVVTKTLNNIKTNLTNNGGSMSGVDPSLVTDLLTAITSLLNSISENTAPTEKIYAALTDYIEYVKGNKESNQTTTNNQNTNKVNMPTTTNDIDTNIASLVSTLSAIARG